MESSEGQQACRAAATCSPLHPSFGLSPILIYSYRLAVAGGEAICHSVCPLGPCNRERIKENIWVILSLKMSHFIIPHELWIANPFLFSNCWSFHCHRTLYCESYDKLPPALCTVWARSKWPCLTLFQTTHKAVCVWFGGQHVFTATLSFAHLLKFFPQRLIWAPRPLNLMTYQTCEQEQ